MDITLLQMWKKKGVEIMKSFNPCFNGYYTFTVTGKQELKYVKNSFNPCFNGYYTFTRAK